MTVREYTPPRLARWLLGRFQSRRAAYMLGDLNEEFTEFAVDRLGYRRARLWFWWQVLRSLPSLVFEPMTHSQNNKPRPWRPHLPLIRDIRHAIRGLRRSPGFALAVVLMLGVGVGVGASVFSLVDVLLLRAPPGIERPEEIKWLGIRRTDGGRDYVARSLAWIDYEAIKSSTGPINNAAAWFSTRRSLGRGMGARNIHVMLVTPSLFDVLEARPALGRFFRSDEDYIGASPIPCIASHRFWSTELEHDAAALGRELTVGERQCTVVGVAAPSFNGPSIRAVDLWLPLQAASAESQGRDASLWTTDQTHWLRIISRIPTEISTSVATQAAGAAYRGFTERVRDPDLLGTPEWESIIPGQTAWGREVNIAKLLFAASVLLLLLIAMNLANLLVVRELSRARESAIRVALGSPIGRLFSASIWEAVVLSVGAAVVGMTLAAWLGQIVRSTLLSNIEFSGSPLTLRVTLFTVGVALLTGVIIAAVASLRAGTSDPGVLLRTAGSARSGRSKRQQATGMLLVGAQAALAVTLLVGSFAFVASFHRAAQHDLGFDREGVFVARPTLSYDEFTVEEQRETYQQLWQQVIGVPGVVSASLGYMTPWWNNRNERIRIPGRDSLPEDPYFGTPAFDMVTPDYLATMGLRMRTGRWFTEQDVAGSAPVVVVNEALRDLYWPNDNPIGHCMYIGDDPGTPCREVVGVVGNHTFTGTLSTDPVSAYFLPYAQTGEYGIVPRLFVRLTNSESPALQSVVRLVQEVKPNLPAADVIALEERFEPLIAPWRMGSYAFTALGVLATAVGTFGLFSILSYIVTGRRHEFAVRAAIGGSVSQIAMPVVRQGVLTVLLGAGIGCVLTFFLRGVLQPLLFETNLTAPTWLIAAAFGAVSVALFATVMPARNAGRGNPLEALRSAD